MFKLKSNFKLMHSFQYDGQQGGTRTSGQSTQTKEQFQTDALILV